MMSWQVFMPMSCYKVFGYFYEGRRKNHSPFNAAEKNSFSGRILYGRMGRRKTHFYSGSFKSIWFWSSELLSQSQTKIIECSCLFNKKIWRSFSRSSLCHGQGDLI